MVKHNNYDDKSIAKDTVIDRITFDRRTDGMPALVQENKEDDSTEENELSAINNDSAQENNEKNSTKENESSIINNDSVPENSEEDSTKENDISIIKNDWRTRRSSPQ